MKCRADFIVLIVGVLVMASIIPGRAQEKSSDPINEEVIDVDEKYPDYFISGDEETHNNQKTVVRDSVVTKSPAAKPKDKSEKQSSEGEEVLSFNFLYYIIQRFKMSDIMDE